MNLFSLSLGQAWQLLGWTMILFLAAGTVVLLIGGALRVILKPANPSVRYASSLVTLAVLTIAPIVIAISFSREAQRVADKRVPVNREAQRVADERAMEHTTKDTNNTKKELNAEATNLPPLTREARLTEATRRQESSSTAAPTADVIKFDFANLLNHSAAYLPWLWIVGTPLTFLLLATGLIGAERLRSSCQAVNAGPLRGACDELRAALGISRQVGVAICERIATPLLVGVAKPLILLPPAALNGWTTAELEMVLVHELSHVRRWDNAVNLGQRVVESLLFFHPAVWVVSGWVRRDREDCCDAVVVRHTAKPQAYAELLLALASHQPLAGLAATGMAQHPIAARVRRILKLEDEPMLVTRKGLFVGVSAVVVAALLAFALPTTDAEEPVNREAQRVEDERTDVNREAQRVEDERTDVSREAERVADERAVKQTTNDTNNTKEELNAEPAKSAEKNSLFPTLEDQRAADLAYKLLGVELEKLTPEELERVKAKGYRGGLRVTQTKAIAENEMPRADSLRFGDLLVGLHVWPTESLSQAQEILTRDDLDQLSPLKFYAMRRSYERGGRGRGGGGFGGGSPTGPDELVTGRIQVDLDAWRAMREPTLKQLVALETQIQDELAKKENLLENVPAQERAMLDAEIDQMREILKQMGRKIATRTSQEKQMNATDERLGLAEGSGHPIKSNSSNPFAGETELLYDGKTFDEWRNLWKSELKTEKRVECIKALAAFGRAGKGKEAAEAILDVAAEYDFGKGEGGSATDLKSAISQVLGGYEGIPGQYWLPLLIDRLKTDPDRWGSFAEWVLSDVSGANTLGYLKQIAADDSLPADARNAALACIASHPEVAEDADALQMVREALLRDPPVMEIVNTLRFDRMDLFPQQVEPLLDKDNAIRHPAINSLQGPFYRKASIPILNELLKVIDDPNRAADHAGAISALASLGLFFDNVPDMGKRRQDVTNRLAKILVEGDEELLAVTLQSMSTLSGQSAEELVKNGSERLGDKISDERREALKKAVKQVKEWMGGDGGRGRGGYGAEMSGGGAF